MSDGVHLLIPFASATAEGCRQALAGLALPHLEKLLVRLSHVHTDAGEETSLSMPHERVLAHEYGLPWDDGRIPLAAWQMRHAKRDSTAAAWAWITPCHWHVAADHIAMGRPQDLKPDARDSQALLAAMKPYFEQDGITLEYDAPTLWLARGELFRDLPTASLDRVVSRTIDRWIPRNAEAAALRRLQQEMQMLLYTHEVNEARLRGGLLPVNSFWVSGTGALPAAHAAKAPKGLQITHDLRDAALQEDWRGWTGAWQQLDSMECLRLAQRLDHGDEVTLTLCGERNAQTWSSEAGSRLSHAARALGSLFGRKRAAALLETL